MEVSEIPDEVVQLFNQVAGKVHRADGLALRSLAQILTMYDETMVPVFTVCACDHFAVALLYEYKNMLVREHKDTEDVQRHIEQFLSWRKDHYKEIGHGHTCRVSSCVSKT